MSIIYEPTYDSKSGVEAQTPPPPTPEEICNELFEEIRKDPSALGRLIAEVREVRGDIEMTSDEMSELWEDC